MIVDDGSAQPAACVDDGAYGAPQLARRRSLVKAMPEKRPPR